MKVKIKNIPVSIELANTFESRQRGLMKRSSLPHDGGMLFVFPDCTQRSFWMKNTYIPLSIAYISEDNRILNIENMFPFDESHVSSAGPAKYALEMNQGWFRRNGVIAGDKIDGLTEFVILEKLRSRRGKLLNKPSHKKLIRESIHAVLNEGVEFREVDSPLEYGRSGNVKRIALCDSSVTDPPGKHDSYFAEIERWRKYTTGRTRRKLKKPVLDEIIPGVSDVCIIGFLDYHQEAKLEGGTIFWYIDYMKTRQDKRGQGSASQLVERFYETVPQPGDYVNFGKMMQPQVGHLKDKMAEKYPEIKTKGAKYF
jgi:uncharacterized membrane protein (UPF0127 family)/GNAT superfamily N-acetyltransferase